MIRFLTFLFNKPYEVCKSCQTLKEQLDYERANNKQLQDTLISILKPTIQEAVPTEITPIIQTGGLFSRRKAELEKQDRIAASIQRSSKVIAKPDAVVNEMNEKLEQELGIKEG